MSRTVTVRMGLMCSALCDVEVIIDDNGEVVDHGSITIAATGCVETSEPPEHISDEELDYAAELARAKLARTGRGEST